MTETFTSLILMLGLVFLGLVSYIALLLQRERRFAAWFEQIPPPYTMKGEIVIGYNDRTNVFTHVEKERLDEYTVRGVEGVFRDPLNCRLIYLCYGMGVPSLKFYRRFHSFFWDKVFEGYPQIEIIYIGTYEFVPNKGLQDKFRNIANSVREGSMVSSDDVTGG